MRDEPKSVAEKWLEGRRYDFRPAHPEVIGSEEVQELGEQADLGELSIPRYRPPVSAAEIEFAAGACLSVTNVNVGRPIFYDEDIRLVHVGPEDYTEDLGHGHLYARTEEGLTVLQQFGLKGAAIAVAEMFKMDLGFEPQVPNLIASDVESLHEAASFLNRHKVPASFTRQIVRGHNFNLIGALERILEQSPCVAVEFDNRATIGTHGRTTFIIDAIDSDAGFATVRDPLTGMLCDVELEAITRQFENNVSMLSIPKEFLSYPLPKQEKE